MTAEHLYVLSTRESYLCCTACQLQISNLTSVLYHYFTTDIYILSLIADCPDKPINLEIFNVSSRSLTINWTEPHDNNDPITGYSISYQNSHCFVMANGVPQNVTVFSPEDQVTITGLHAGEYYTFAIIAINDICSSQPTVPATVHTTEEGM